jgi:hypothetical protein
MMKMVTRILESEFVHATVRVREKEPCAGTAIADAVSEYVNQVDIKHSESTGNGWRQVLAYVPIEVPEKDLEVWQKYPKMLKNWKMLWLSKANQNVVALEVIDRALNEVMGMKGSFQRLEKYVATPKYEDFSMIIFPVFGLTNIIETLSKHAKANVMAQDTRPLDELKFPPFSFDLFKVPKLMAEEEQIMKLAFDLGWFEYPRPTGASVADIAEKLAMSPSTVDIRLRTISRKLCRYYFERYGP